MSKYIKETLLDNASKKREFKETKFAFEEGCSVYFLLILLFQVSHNAHLKRVYS